MAEFNPNQPVRTEDPSVEVTLTPQRPLPPGRHRYRLQVVDDSGNESEPDEVVVIVLDQERPTAVLRAPSQVPFGRSFRLDGSSSQAAGQGRITSYIWTYLGTDSR